MIINPIIYYKNIDKEIVPCTYPGIDSNKYYISKSGLIFSTYKNGYLNPEIDKYGYLRVHLMTNNGAKHFLIHRLVAWEFIINPHPDLFNLVNHIDGNKLNNNYYNLEWCDNAYNKYHSVIMGLSARGEKHGNSKFNEELVRNICSLFEKGYSKKQVLEIFDCNFKSNRSLYDLIFILYNKKGWKHIICEYSY